MNFQLLDSKYGKQGAKTRNLKNVKRGVAADSLAKVGNALAHLQGDELGAATLIQKQGISLARD